MTPLTVAGRFLGLTEIPGDDHNPQIAAMVGVIRAEIAGRGVAHVGNVPADDETPWCSAFVGYIAWLFDAPRPSRTPGLAGLALRARAWLKLGIPMEVEYARPGDVVIYNRAEGPNDPTVINAPGHVGFFVRREGEEILTRGGNQGNRVSDRPYPIASLLGIRRWEAT